MRSWIKASLGMYIDDGVIFACGRDWDCIEAAMRDWYSECVEWLTRARLNVDPDKMELLFFKERGNAWNRHVTSTSPIPHSTPTTGYRRQARSGTWASISTRVSRRLA